MLKLSKSTIIRSPFITFLELFLLSLPYKVIYFPLFFSIIFIVIILTINIIIIISHILPYKHTTHTTQPPNTPLQTPGYTSLLGSGAGRSASVVEGGRHGGAEEKERSGIHRQVHYQG